MKKRLVKTALAIIIITLLVRLDIVDALLVFMLAGVIPGTEFSIPSFPMLLLTTGAIWIILLKTVPLLKTAHKNVTLKLEKISG